MEITCPRCRSLHEIEPPASVRARGPRSLKFRCSHCGHTFTVDPGGNSEAAPASAPALSAPTGEPVSLVRLDGKDIPVADLAAVQRLIVDGRIGRDALLSNHGMRWTRAGDREDLAVFFRAYEAITFQERNLRTELRPAEEEIVVDMEEAYDRTPGVPVAVGPTLDPLGRQDLDTMVVDFGLGRDDTVEQTVGSGGIDELAIPEVPAGFARAEPDPTERLRSAPVMIPPGAPAPPAVSGIPVPASINTITPADAPRGSAAFGPGPRPPSTLVPNPSLSQSFFLDPSPVVSRPAASPSDVFDDPPSTSGTSRSNLVPMIAGAAVLGAMLLVGAVFAFWPSPSEPAAEPGTEAAVAPPEPTPPADVVPPADPTANPEQVTPEPPATPPGQTPPETPAPPPEKPTEPPVKPPPTPAEEPTEPQPRPPIKPKVEPKPSSAKLVSNGWKTVESGDYQAAHALFDKALSSAPSASAYYGRAYANEKLGDTVSAAEDYCNALGIGSVDVGTSREIEAGLRRIGRTCP